MRLLVLVVQVVKLSIKMPADSFTLGCSHSIITPLQSPLETFWQVVHFVCGYTAARQGVVV